MINNLTRRY